MTKKEKVYQLLLEFNLAISSGFARSIEDLNLVVDKATDAIVAIFDAGDGAKVEEEEKQN